MEDSQPITLHIPPALIPYKRSAADLLVEHSKARAVAVGTYVFAHPAGTDIPHLLLIQREKGDGRLAGKWEIPGGGCEDSDPTVLHSAARELFEEAGLHMTAAVDKIGEDRYFITRSGLSVVKLSFEVRVQEVVDGVASESIPVEISHEHQSFAWATEAEVEENVKYPMTHVEQRQDILTAYRHHKARIARAGP